MLDKKLEKYAESRMYPFHMPGHKRTDFGMTAPYQYDITEIDGFDNLHHPTGILQEAQHRAAQMYGAKASYYLVNGSSCGLLAAISGVTQKGDSILIARNCHKAVYHALLLRELKTHYIYPNLLVEGLQGEIDPAAVEAALQQDAGIKAVVITSPTYEGIASDIESIATITHAHRIPLIVDAAHGAHLGFSDKFLKNAIQQGADVVIMSLHKTLPSFTQTALLHLNSDIVDEKQIEKYLRIFQTSSPSYLFMAGMEKCLRYVQQNSKNLFDAYYGNLCDFYKQTADLKRLRVYQHDKTKSDIGKLIIFTGKTSMSGMELADRLRTNYQLEVEMATDHYVLAMTSIMDTPEGLGRLGQALQQIDATAEVVDNVTDKNNKVENLYRPYPKRMEIYEAETYQSRECELTQAKGLISAGFISLYPPGIPILVPGEEISGSFLEDITKCQNLGLTVDGLTKENGINVVNCTELYYT